MSRQLDTGNLGEEAVCRYLTERGYEILGRNFRICGAELDIVARKREDIAFVEVKTRMPGSLASGFDAVGKAKQRRIIRAGYRFCEQHDIGDADYFFRYDIAEVICQCGQIISIDYLENAFDESDIS
ncbi:MAG: YraN family protein [Oscillospiraceae bacterium]|nr:YraN family protein [Oscillospiraceae bacterium]